MSSQQPRILDPSGSVPKYFHFATVICESFRSHPIGAQLPPLTELAEKFMVSKQTINRSMRCLAEMGFVKSERGRGTVILKDLGDALGLPRRSSEIISQPAVEVPSKHRSVGMVLKARGGMAMPDAHLAEIEIVVGLQRRLRDHGIDLGMVVVPGGGPEVLERELREAAHLQGFIFMVKMLDRAEAERVAALGKPAVVVNEDDFSDILTSVIAAEAEGVRKVMDHLIGLGHRRIAFLKWEGGGTSPRLAGYRSALQAHNIEPDPSWEIKWDYRGGGPQAYIRENIKKFLGSLGKCTAVFSPVPRPAMGICQGLRDLGMVPGKDLSVACFGVPEEEWKSISEGSDKLTMVAKPRLEMGYAAAQVLLDQIERGYAQSGVIRVPTKLMVGNTTDTPPPSGKAA